MGRVGVAGYSWPSTRAPRRHAWGPRRAPMALAIQVASPFVGVPNASFPAGDRPQRLRQSVRAGGLWSVGRRGEDRFTQDRSRGSGAAIGAHARRRRLRRCGSPRQTHRVPQTGQVEEARRGREKFLHHGLRRGSLNRRCLDTPGRSGLCCRREAPDGKRRVNSCHCRPPLPSPITLLRALSHGR